MSNRDDNRMDFIALKIKSGLPLSPAEQTHWDQHVHLGDKIKSGLPLTPEEQEKWDRAKEAIVSVRSGGVIVVEAPPMTVEQWKKKVAESRGKGFGIAPEQTTGGSNS